MPLKPFYTIAELMALAGVSRGTINAMLRRHSVEMTEITSGKRPKRVVMLTALKDAMPGLFRSIMASTAANERK